MGPGNEASGGSAAQHHRRHRRARRPDRLHRQGGGRSARRRVHARHPRRRRHLRHARRLIGGLPTARCLDLRHARRAADDADVPRRDDAARSRGRQHGLHHRRPRWCTSKATSGISRAPRRRCATPRSRRSKAGVKVALTLSDSFCVGRFRDEFLELVEKHVDILFANESEILSLYQVETFRRRAAAGARRTARSRR